MSSCVYSMLQWGTALNTRSNLIGPQHSATRGLYISNYAFQCWHLCKHNPHPRSAQHRLQVRNRGCYNVLLRMQASTGGQAGFQAAMGLLQDPDVCKLLYPYLPANMRNPEGVKLMMSDPQIKAKLEVALEQAFKNNPHALTNLDVKKSAEEVGINAVEVMKAIMADPELSQACSKPEVLAAVMECYQDSGKLAEHEHDPQVKKVLEKLQQMLPY